MSSSVQAGRFARDLGHGLLQIAVLGVLVAAGCLVAALLISWAGGRAVGDMAALVCGVVGPCMVFGGFLRDPTLAPRSQRRQRRAKERELERMRNPAERARAELEADAPRSVVSSGGVVATAGLLVVVLGFAADAVLNPGV